MKFYNDFNSMFNAQSGLKKDMSVFNRVDYVDEVMGDGYYNIVTYVPEYEDYGSIGTVYPDGCGVDAMSTGESYPYTLFMSDLDYITEHDLRKALRSVGFSDIYVIRDKTPGGTLGGLWASGKEPLGYDAAKRVAEILNDKYA